MRALDYREYMQLAWLFVLNTDLPSLLCDCMDVCALSMCMVGYMSHKSWKISRSLQSECGRHNAWDFFRFCSLIIRQEYPPNMSANIQTKRK